ncbi:unnamed protein product [Arctia plantaginis]|uniref:Uncharacterized protein n=1 Tax=Arctia plantaginis TaxID=874455 RepID=A0A8S0ZG01_ARCPL|nr:unnamed protein product [Arctia plantaginis]
MNIGKYLKRLSELNDFKSEAKLKRTDLSVSLQQSSSDQSTQTTVPSLTSKPKVVLWPDDYEITKRIDKTIMDLIIVDMPPYTLMEGEAFRRLNLCDPQGVRKYRLKSEKYFRTSLMPKTYERIRSKVQDLMAQSKWASATTDIWTNAYKTCSLLSFTAHFIINYKRFKVILGACVLEQDHYIEQKFTDTVNE